MFLKPLKSIKKILIKDPENYWIFNMMTWILSIIGILEKLWPAILNFVGCFILSSIIVIILYPVYANANQIKQNDLFQMAAVTIIASLLGTLGFRRKR